VVLPSLHFRAGLPAPGGSRTESMADHYIPARMSQVPYFKDGEFKGSINYDAHCAHPDASRTGETCRDGCCDYYECPDCHKRFLVECPD
jgi:hypothetical protein